MRAKELAVVQLGMRGRLAYPLVPVRYRASVVPDSDEGTCIEVDRGSSA